MYTNKKSGFTLYELLVVIAIISVLAGIVFAAVNEALPKGRDAKRDADIQNLSVALRLYAEKHGYYPNAAQGNCDFFNSFAEGGCLQVLVTEGFISELPTDPQNEEYSSSGTPGAPATSPNIRRDQMYYYNNWCRVGVTGGTGINSDQYRLWANGEKNHDATIQGWWEDEIIGKTNCVDPS